MAYQRNARKGISDTCHWKAAPYFLLEEVFCGALQFLSDLLKDSRKVVKGVGELSFIITPGRVGIAIGKFQIDVTFGQSLNYYTGAKIWIAAPAGVSMGSIGGGGSLLNDLTGILRLKDVSGVGISFGLDRIYLVLEELGFFRKLWSNSLQVLCVNLGIGESVGLLWKLIEPTEEWGVNCDLYPVHAKMPETNENICQ